MSKGPSGETDASGAPAESPGSTGRLRRLRRRLGAGAERVARGYRDLVLNVDERPDWALAGLFVGMGVAVMLAQYAFVYFGVQGISQFRVDARTVWRPLAESVLTEGEPLYGPDQFENKPPLWQYLNLGVAFVGPYYLLFYVLTGIAHGAVAWCVYAWSRRHGAARLGAVAAVLFLGAVHAGFMARIDPRPFAAVLVFAALLTSRASVAGASLAAATTLIQYAAFAVPVVVWRAVRGRSRRAVLRWTGAFALAGGFVVAAVYGAVGLVWGPTALEYAVRYTVLMTADYTTSHSAVVVPVRLVGGHLAWSTELYAVVLPASLAVATFLVGDRDWTGLRGESALLTGVLTVPFLIRGHGMYWYSPLPFLAVLAAFGFRDFFASEGG